MVRMRDLTDDFKLSFRSTPGINEAFSGLVVRTAGDKSIRYRGKKAHRSAVVNAIVLYVCSLPPAEQRALLSRGTTMLNDHLDETGADSVGSPTEIVIPKPNRVSEAVEPAPSKIQRRGRA